MTQLIILSQSEFPGMKSGIFLPGVKDSCVLKEVIVCAAMDTRHQCTVTF